MRVGWKPRVRRIAAAGGLIGALIFVLDACDNDEPAGPIFEPGGILVKVSECKESERLAASPIGPDRDFVEYQLTTKNVLVLRHVNAAFNCCPGTISAGATIRGDTLTITERQSARGCDCTCLYDLEYRITGMTPGTYTTVIREPYTKDGDETIDFTVDMKKYPRGRFSAPRNHYPWLPGPETANQATFLMAYQACLGTGACVPSFDYVPSDLDCVEYRGGGGNRFVLDHFNAIFSCCPDRVFADIALSDNVINVVEREGSPRCDCQCVYDVHYEIRGLEPRQYAVTFSEPRVGPSEEQIAFTVDLADAPLNFSGVYRDKGLWYCASTYAYDTLALGKMHRTVSRVAISDTCFSDGACRFIGLGVTPCGGTREYIVFSTAPQEYEGNWWRVDLEELTAWVCRYNEHQLALNHRYGLASPCPTPAVPQPGCVQGKCVDLNGL